MENENDNQGGQPEELSALDRIALEAGFEEQAQAKADHANLHPELERIDPAEAWAQLPLMLGGLLSIAMPELREAYNPKACYQWGGAMAMVAEKYGWDAATVIGPELALVAASVPLVLPTYFAIKARRDKVERERPVQAEPAREPAEASQPRGPMDQAPGGFSVPA
ncbi:hypothetical protein [Pseudoduganella namucuonensis]|uniref:Uncharacterized protein n=1 Tax=Pseudoduganella namucuonensis TaxID=1035707 RepID=A0A1I7KQA0_9BURK|nr:hypothetical protein [Pseudoduganella namucuonensis]SFU99589.1 hypothetical protein SAMN05216552_1018129 [Pseudoduganella namucuonensis]